MHETNEFTFTILCNTKLTQPKPSSLSTSNSPSLHMTSPPHRAGKTPARRLDPPPPPAAAINCPRCDSQNTKFCYYNNYSLAQPRHFCKTCRRYWTKGGALRSVPVGGGCRRTKKPAVRPSSSSGSSSSNHRENGGLKLFQGLSPALDFQHNYGHPNTALSFGDFSANSSNPNSGIPSHLLGFNYCNQSLGFQEVGPTFLNQDHHQQRLAMLFAGNNNIISNNNQNQVVNSSIPLSINQTLVRNSGTPVGTSPRREGVIDGDLSTEWFFDDNYTTRGDANPAPASSGIRAWNELTRF